jgi:hypothetical protein
MLYSVDRGFEPWSGQTKDYKVGICCFSAKHTALREREKTGQLGISIMCPSGTTCLIVDCCFSELPKICFDMTLFLNFFQIYNKIYFHTSVFASVEHY